MIPALVAAGKNIKNAVGESRSNGAEELVLRKIKP